MKKLIIAIGLAATLLTSYGQTTTNPPPTPAISGPLAEALTFGSGASTNWGVATYGIISSHGTKYGGGLAGLYRLNDFVVPTLRLDYYDSRVWMPSASLTLQAPLKVYGLTAIPMMFTGLATPLSGRGDSDNTAVGIAGVGMAFRLFKHVDAVWDIEKWSGFEDYQYRAGIVYKFGW